MSVAFPSSGSSRSRRVGLILTGVVFSVVGAGLCHHALTRRAACDRDEPRCAQCGYIVRGLAHPRCPECGSDLHADGAIRRERPMKALAAIVAFGWLLLVPLPITVILTAVDWLGRHRTGQAPTLLRLEAFECPCRVIDVFDGTGSPQPHVNLNFSPPEGTGHSIRVALDSPPSIDGDTLTEDIVAEWMERGGADLAKSGCKEAASELVAFLNALAEGAEVQTAQSSLRTFKKTELSYAPRTGTTGGWSILVGALLIALWCLTVLRLLRAQRCTRALRRAG